MDNIGINQQESSLLVSSSKLNDQSPSLQYGSTETSSRTSSVESPTDQKNQNKYYDINENTYTDYLSDTGDVEFIDEDPVDGHSSKCLSCTKWISRAFGSVLKSAMFGGLDGISCVFVSVATVYSGDLRFMAVLIIGIAKLFSGAISMGIGDFMSTKAELDLIQIEKKREKWECENFLKGEKDEMVEIYQEMGIKKDIAQKMVDIMSSKTDAFVDVMMVQELGMNPDVDPYEPLKNGITNFCSFMVFGSVPLIIYAVIVVLEYFDIDYYLTPDYIFYIDCAITGLTLCLMGLIKGMFSTQRWYTSVIFTVFVGAIAAASGYLVAYLLQKVLHIDNIG